LGFTVPVTVVALAVIAVAERTWSPSPTTRLTTADGPAHRAENHEDQGDYEQDDPKGPEDWDTEEEPRTPLLLTVRCPIRAPRERFLVAVAPLAVDD